MKRLLSEERTYARLFRATDTRWSTEMMVAAPRHVSGFTLVEIATVLVIVGLVMAGVLKSQEVMTGARVRNLVTQQGEIKAAFYAFQDRYHALPGDYASASTNISCGIVPCIDGDGNGLIEAPNAAAVHEEILSWNHLSAAGLLKGSYTMASSATAAADRSNTPENTYNVYLQLTQDTNWGRSDNESNRLNIKTGSQIPVQILAEVDRKIDDGKPYSGTFQFSVYAPSPAVAPSAEHCVPAGDWNVIEAETNCGAANTL